MSNETKLAELRHRTDHDLLILVNSELDHALTLADVAATKGSPLYALADSAYSEAQALLPKIANLRPSERANIEDKLKELRFLLDQVPSFASAQRHPAAYA